MGWEMSDGLDGGANFAQDKISKMLIIKPPAKVDKGEKGPVSLRVHLYKNYFTLSSIERPIPYNGPLSDFVDALNTLSIGQELLSSLPAKFFENGRFKVECVDHRFIAILPLSC